VDKPIYWMGRSRDTVRHFPKATKEQVGYQLYRLQKGLTPTDWKPLKTVGKGAMEIGLHVPHEHRIVYVAKYEEAVYVLHAFEKKQQKTAKREIAIALKAYSTLIESKRRKK
jgi:phage-related protein